jgi:hypothetical protein
MKGATCVAPFSIEDKEEKKKKRNEEKRNEEKRNEEKKLSGI